MKRKNMVGLGKVVISRRERIVMLEPFGKGLMATTLRYAYEVRDAVPYFEDIPSMTLPDEMIELAEHILETKAGHFDPAEFEDRYENAVVEMLKQKQAGIEPRKEAPVTPPATVVSASLAVISLRRSRNLRRGLPMKWKAQKHKNATANVPRIVSITRTASRTVPLDLPPSNSRGSTPSTIAHSARSDLLGVCRSPPPNPSRRPFHRVSDRTR